MWSIIVSRIICYFKIGNRSLKDWNLGIAPRRGILGAFLFFSIIIEKKISNIFIIGKIVGVKSSIRTLFEVEGDEILGVYRVYLSLLVATVHF